MITDRRGPNPDGLEVIMKFVEENRCRSAGSELDQVFEGSAVNIWKVIVLFGVFRSSDGLPPRLAEGLLL